MTVATTYLAWAQRRACEGKKQFASKKDAKRAASDSATHFGEPRSWWSSYRCWFCRMWHIGHKGGSR